MLLSREIKDAVTAEGDQMNRGESAVGNSFAQNDGDTDSDVILQLFSITVSYPVQFTQRLFDTRNSVFADTLSHLEPTKKHRFVAIVDDGVLAAWPKLSEAIDSYVEVWNESMDLVAPLIAVPGGEQCKNDPQLVESLLSRLYEFGIDRHSYVVAIGGGALLDLVGYVAATCHRGVRLVRVPTTVLAQNDSGVGVKNGVNAFSVKNYLGCFAPPFAVINDFDFLETLSARDRIAGVAEAIKVGLIRDPSFFAWIESAAGSLRNFEPPAMEFVIRRCAELHLNHIGKSGDPFEQGSARPLDYGHWSAHKLETLSDHNLRHGEAVAIGMALDARYSAAIGLLPSGEDERICRLLEALGFRLWHSAMDNVGANGKTAVLDGLREFREHLGGVLTVTLLERIGRGIEVHKIDETEMLNSIDWLRDRDVNQ
jgi:3-dehydroquinate synthase